VVGVAAALAAALGVVSILVALAVLGVALFVRWGGG
jgi:hypothetical protein